MVRSAKSLHSALARKLASAPASDIKKIGWRGIVELVHNHDGRLMVTSHDRPQAVILTPEAYSELVEKGNKQDAAIEAALETLRTRFDDRLTGLEGSAGAARLRSAIQSPTKLRGKLKAGANR